MYVEILNPNPTCLLFSAVVWLYSRLLQLVKDSPDENSLLNAFPGQYVPTYPLFPACLKAACLSRWSRLVSGLACRKGFPFPPAAVPIPMTQEMRSCPEQPTSSPALPLQGQCCVGCLLFLSLACSSIHVNLFFSFFFFWTKALCFLSLILYEHPAQASEFLLLRDGVRDAGNFHHFVS